jgi:hypothetical protein
MHCSNGHALGPGEVLVGHQACLVADCIEIPSPRLPAALFLVLSGDDHDDD